MKAAKGLALAAANRGIAMVNIPHEEKPGHAWSEGWADRIRATNKLVRAMANHVLGKSSVSSDQLYGLCKLTWITGDFKGPSASYIRSTKIPALAHVLGADFTGLTIEEVADRVCVITKNRDLGKLIRGESGFTNFYPAYRNSARQWVHDNSTSLVSIFRDAYKLASDDEGLALIRRIERLPGLAKANQSSPSMNASNLLTPVIASLDGRMRFPLINGNPGVVKVLKALGARDAGLEMQYRRMVACYGLGGIMDAADLDQAGQSGDDLSDLLPCDAPGAKSKDIGIKQTKGRFLSLKDERDIAALQESRTVTRRRLHNHLTNRFQKLLSPTHRITEGVSKSAMFDAVVHDYDGGGNDLLVEVKSSVADADVRMAIGQLYSYWFNTRGMTQTHLAILLPQEPDQQTKNLVAWLGIGLMWFEKGMLKTETPSLLTLART